MAEENPIDLGNNIIDLSPLAEAPIPPIESNVFEAEVMPDIPPVPDTYNEQGEIIPEHILDAEAKIHAEEISAVRAKLNEIDSGPKTIHDLWGR